MIDVDSLANEIRRVDGAHSLGAGALAEALMPFVTAHLSQPQPVAHGEAVAWQFRNVIKGEVGGWHDIDRQFAEDPKHDDDPTIEIRRLYAATPTIPAGRRVVPDALPDDAVIFGDDDDDGYRMGWNACRNAMLAASPSAGGV
jgi:hypothetical protein